MSTAQTTSWLDAAAASHWASLNMHAPVLAVLLPLTAALLLLFLDDARARWQLNLRRGVSLGFAGAGLLLALALLRQASTGQVLIYPMGNWPAPFGIVLMLDRLSALMVALTYCVALPSLWYACGGWDQRGRYFHPMFHFQLMGLSGAFLSGDLFNLFVFFEVLLLASYVLMLHGLGAQRLRVGFQYVTLNLLASGLFLIGLGLIYGNLGTLNMVDVARGLAGLPPDQALMVKVAGLVLLAVFGLKAALLPFYFWLPATYAAASAPVAALFAIMTKVGVYAIVRVNGFVLGDLDGGLLGAVWLLPLALLTSVLGVLGALAAHTLSRLVAHLTVASVGTLLAAVALSTPAGLSAALYYMLHSTIVMTGLFLLVELMASQRGSAGEKLQPAHALREPVLLGFMMLFGAASAAGLPPLPGFLGKVMILQSAASTPAAAWVWAVVLSVGLLTLIGLSRAGVIVFWHVQPLVAEPDAAGRHGSRLLPAVWAVMGMTLALAAWASPVMRYTEATARQLQQRALYTQAVLGQGEASTRAYDGRFTPRKP